ncbi:uncharacterized protein [Venturia canescens]|uniref:uncharacterized protein n=1 Tax=Venturia canescens TaxID=32260 RepID=UPI001C9C33E8|nr:uncharacterized protein LOC122414980 [Venturia canescens]
MEDLDEEDDVIIEGSELHQALVKMGYSDFEFTPVNKEFKSYKEPSRKNEWSRMFKTLLQNWYPKNRRFSSKQFHTILSVKCLLDDHFEHVQTFLDNDSSTFWDKSMEWLPVLGFGISAGISYLMLKKRQFAATFSAASVAAMITFHKYEEFQAIKALKNLVIVQNELYYLYKKSLGILRNVYRLRPDGKKPPSKFSKLEVNRLKYLQPLTETLLRSMGKIAHTYYYASSTTIELLPESVLEQDILTSFDTQAFVIEGEITYESFKHLYYVYILVQSELMQLFAVAYDLDQWRDSSHNSLSQLTRITLKLCDSLSIEKNQLEKFLTRFESSERTTNERKIKFSSASKCRDLYLNLNLLSRKLQITYDEIASVLEQIEKHENGEAAELMSELAPKIQEIHSQIEKSRNFAEFNNLLVAVIQRPRHGAQEVLPSEADPLEPEIEDDRAIVRDSEPRIIDEVFEEYITEEYLKPLYEESDDLTMEIAKLDKLLAKNFMSELKEVLVEKNKSMSEREAKALLRKYPGLRERTNSEENHVPVNESKNGEENMDIPRLPPLPRLVEVSEGSPKPFSQKETRSRGPVPLPRARNIESPNIFVPRPPPLPSLLQTESPDDTERLSINLPFPGPRNIPVFVNCEEEFIGSGENSEEELELNSDSS